MAAKLVSIEPAPLPGYAIVSNDVLNDMLEAAEGNEARVAKELETYASLGVPVMVPIYQLQRWQRAVSISSDVDE